MASWHRVMADKSRRFSLLHSRWYSLLGCESRPLFSGRGGGWPVSSRAPEEFSGVPARMRDGVQYMAARFFAAPVQARTKEEPKLMQGPRLNEAITAKFIRLVTDEGHAIVSREEALNRARRLDLDLVEVQRTAKPPVCKIMDYHKEKYKKEVTVKERAKIKSESTVRKGDFKEVRLKGKIEQKDIEVKAETVKGLIERGYRVKCMALPSKQRGTEECDLGALLSRLTDLIEDVIIVESGPFVEKQQAYVVVRHAKFGQKKGSRKKASYTVETTSGTASTASTPTPFDSAPETVEPMGINEVTEDDIFSDPEDDAQDLPSSAPTSSLMFDSVTGRNVVDSSLTGKLDSLGVMISKMTEESPASKTAYSSMKGKLGSERDRHVPPKPGISLSEISAEGSNRYSGRMEMKSRSNQTNPARRNGMVTEERGTPECSGFSSPNGSNKFGRSPGIANSGWMEQQRSNQGNILPQPLAFENQKREHLDLKHGQMSPNDSSPAPTYGIFSSQKPPTSDIQRVADVNKDKERSPPSNSSKVPNPPRSKVETTWPNNDKAKQGGWGVFSGSVSNPSQDKSAG